jgi:RNA polymerase sigma-70 factor (ECF subfamily)
LRPPTAIVDATFVQDLLASGGARWPDLTTDASAFERHVRALCDRSEPPQLRHAADLYLAFACATGVPGAVAAFEALFAGTLASAIARIDGSPAFLEETAQALRVKLFVRDPPKIASYGGRAKLSSWLTTFAARGALDEREAAGEPTEHSSLADRLESGANPEVDYIRARYKADFEAAVAAALTRLTGRERGLLRLHLGARMSIDGLAVAYGVGRSTAARWLASAREKLLKETHSEVRARLGATESAIRDFGLELGSQLAVSVVRLLGSSSE